MVRLRQITKGQMVIKPLFLLLVIAVGGAVVVSIIMGILMFIHSQRQ